MKKIKYSKERLRSTFRMGIFFTVIGIILVLISFVIEKWNDLSIQAVRVGQICAGILIFINYYFENTKQYLSIGNGIIKVNEPFGKKLNLAEIKHIKKFAGDYILKTDKKKLTIDTQIIDPNSFIELNAELKN